MDWTLGCLKLSNFDRIRHTVKVSSFLLCSVFGVCFVSRVFRVFSSFHRGGGGDGTDRGAGKSACLGGTTRECPPYGKRSSRTGTGSA